MTKSDPTTQQDRHVYSVSELNRDVKTLLDRAFPLLWIQGEISNFSRPSSGHWYFTLKDKQGQIRAAMFKMRNRHIPFTPENGTEVVVRAKVSLYEPRGDYQLIVEHMEEAGAGALQRAFDELKHKLQSQGLFDTDHKRAIPTHPGVIGVITSPSGAAIRDILSILKRRLPGLPVILYPVPVQGEDAGKQIATMIAKAAQRNEVDVLILSRGGGSLEDLWAFNEEVVAHAIYDCAIPIVCGVGHEIDFTIADFVADRRAPTPSAAAELVTPDREELEKGLQALNRRLNLTTRNQLISLRERIRNLSKQLTHPSQTLQRQAQRIDDLEARLAQSISFKIRQEQTLISNSISRLYRFTPSNQLQQFNTKYRHLEQRLMASMKHILHNKQVIMANSARGLHTVSPLSTLERGYAIVQKPDESIVRSIKDVDEGDKIYARLGHGRLLCAIEEKIDN